MLQPKREKFRKQFRGKRRGLAIRGSKLAFGEFGLKSVGRGWVTANQIESGRRVIVRFLRKGGRSWVRIFPDKPVTSRAAGHRMGGGKGDVSGHVAVVTPGRIIFEMAGVTAALAQEALIEAGSKMPIKTRFISREE